jgi:hypothetical protein
MRIALAVSACAATMLLGGCGGGSSGGQPGAEASPGQHDAGGGSGSSGPDAPVSGPDQASASLPGLPIGGSVSFDAAGSTTCAVLAWNGDTLPDGVVVRISDLSYPDGVSDDGGVSCDGPPCLDADSFTPDRQSCTVGLAWDGTPPTDPEPSISASGSAICPTQDVCDQLASDAESGGGVASVDMPVVTEPSAGSNGSSEPSDASS